MLAIYSNNFTYNYDPQLRGGIFHVNDRINIADLKNIYLIAYRVKRESLIHNCIGGNNWARVNRIFIMLRAIRELSTDQYKRKEERVNQAGIFIQ